MQSLDTSRPSHGDAITAIGIARAHGGAWRIAAFFVLLCAMALALDAFIGFALRRLTTGDFGDWNRIVGGQVNADIVISGSSRARSHYDPRVLRALTGLSAFNIGLNGSQTDMQLARLKTYLAHNRKPRLLIHNLDAFSLQVSHGEVYDPGQYVPYLAEAHLYRALLRINGDTRKARYVPLYGYAVQDMRLNWLTGLRQTLVPPSTPTLFDGYEPRNVGWTGEFDDFRARNPRGVSIPVEAEGTAQLEELLRLCAQQGVRVVLVYSPEYLEMQSMTSNRTEIFERFETLGRLHGVDLLDFSASPLSSHADNFYNSQHLNAAGADTFTRELAGRLRTLLH